MEQTAHLTLLIDLSYMQMLIQAVQMMLADIAMKVETARLLVYKAGYLMAKWLAKVGRSFLVPRARLSDGPQRPGASQIVALTRCAE